MKISNDDQFIFTYDGKTASLKQWSIPGKQFVKNFADIIKPISSNPPGLYHGIV